MKFSHHLRSSSALLATVALFLACCAEAPTEPEQTAQAVSLLGDPLYAISGKDASYQANLEEAKARFDAAPGDEDAAIWYGRRLAYLDRYQEAIEVYTEALVKHPDSPKLLRHRGHRYLTTRKFVDAIRDLSRAAEIVDSLEDEIEPDGIPNARNEPRSTLKFNIWYHLGLAYFYNGEFSQAYSAFNEAHVISKRNADLLCAATNWLYIATRRIGLHEDATQLLDEIDLTLDVIENKDYLDLLMLYRGHFTVEELLTGETGSSNPTREFGAAHFLLMNGERERAQDLFLKIVDEGQWPAFGAIAAEAELYRLE